MKRVWSGSSLPDTAHFKNVLELNGIECIIKNRELGGGIGDLPVFDAAPELWVLDAAEAARAAALLRDSVRPAAAGTPWRCSACGEENEAQFAACWNCGRRDARPAEHA
jgi:hypothetical protein